MSLGRFANPGWNWREGPDQGGNEGPRGEANDPGSSWKGVFRSSGERIARRKGLKVCSGLTNDNCLKNGGLDKVFLNSLRSDMDQAKRIAWNNTCINCKVFGTISILGQVRFLDSISQDFKLNTRAMTAISRKDGSVVGGALVTLEYADVGSRFPFTLFTYNLPNYALGYMILIMEEIHNHLVQVGGNKSRGFGFLSFEKLSMEVLSGDQSLPKLDEDDMEVKGSLDLRNLSGKEFFERAKPLMEAFRNVKISYPS